MLDQMAFAGTERLHFAQDPQTGMRAIIAIHSTLRGSAIGGCRFLHYAREQDAITDVIRLARGMSYKSALAGLPHSGGKAVLLKPEHSFDRSELMAAFGRMVEQLGGDYIAAMDSGTRVTDMDTIATQTGHVTCTTAFGDPSDWTALGVFEGIKASLLHKTGDDNLAGRHVAIQGMGHVGFALAHRLHQAGAKLTVADFDPALPQRAALEFGANVVSPEAIFAVEADVFSPCGLGGVINNDSLKQLKAGIIAGSANNQLLAPGHGEQLHRNKVLYAPDYLINAGGLIFVARRHAGENTDKIRQQVMQIGSTLKQLYQQAEQQQCATHCMADQQAEAIIAASTHLPPAA